MVSKRNRKIRGGHPDGKQRIQHFVPYLDYDGVKEYHELKTKDQLSTLIGSNIATLWQRFKEDKAAFMVEQYKPSKSVKTHKIDCNVPASVYRRIEFLASHCKCSKTAIVVAALQEAIKGMDNDVDLLASKDAETHDSLPLLDSLEKAIEEGVMEKEKLFGRDWYSFVATDELDELDDDDDDDDDADDDDTEVRDL